MLQGRIPWRVYSEQAPQREARIPSSRGSKMYPSFSAIHEKRDMRLCLRVKNSTDQSFY